MQGFGRSSTTHIPLTLLISLAPLQSVHASVGGKFFFIYIDDIVTTTIHLFIDRCIYLHRPENDDYEPGGLWTAKKQTDPPEDRLMTAATGAATRMTAARRGGSGRHLSILSPLASPSSSPSSWSSRPLSTASASADRISVSTFPMHASATAMRLRSTV
eukprot:GHVU01219676.1.p1 GENE.GHVU01219676.1~~GHVU01219676.1.p1  ORF type:complete len:159 (-),score=17.29 GHVU01219676.1:2678-3154(-)